MLFTYEDYLLTDKSLSLESMLKLHCDMINEIGNDPDSLELYGELIDKATRYASFRAEWSLWSKEKKAERDTSRSSCHDSLIVKFNMLARYLKMQGKEFTFLPPDTRV